MAYALRPTSSRRAGLRRGGSSTLLAVAAAALLAASAAKAAFASAPATAPRAGRDLAPRQLGSRVGMAAKTGEEPRKEEENPLNKIKELGIAGTISYALWESAFWIIGGGGAFAAYVWANGHIPDFSNQEEMAQVGGGAFVFINGARLVVPLRIGLAVSTTPWIDDNIVKKFILKGDESVADTATEEAPKEVKEKAAKELADA